MERIDTLVIGAGVVGLACARSLARRGQEVVIVEAANAIGSVTSARNSEVIHAGLYYPAGSLKARLCVAGKRMLYDYCIERGVAHRRLGKLVVATDASQLDALEALQRQAIANGVDDLQMLDGAALQRLEPSLAAVAALLSPSTGIVDSHGLMLALQGEAEQHGAMLALASPVRGGAVEVGGLRIEVGADAASAAPILAQRVVNAAGLWAPAVAAAIEGLAAAHVPQARFCKGSYFGLSGRAPFKHLIYPVPEAAGLGVHLTLDLGGQARFGPDTEWLADGTHADAIDYAVDAARGAGFEAAIRRYWPGLPAGALQPAYSGVRPKLQAAGGAAHDFMLQGPRQHGVRGLVNLFGIESPGLTAALAIGEEVARLLDDAVG